MHGSGALGIETLSRNASYATFCDKSKEAIKITKKNIEETKLESKCDIINGDYLETLNLLSKDKKKYDIIFIDPPYKSNLGIESIKKIIALDLLSENGIIIFETNDMDKEKDILNIKDIEIYDKRKYGIAFIMFIRKG